MCARIRECVVVNRHFKLVSEDTHEQIYILLFRVAYLGSAYGGAVVDTKLYKKFMFTPQYKHSDNRYIIYYTNYIYVL